MNRRRFLLSSAATLGTAAVARFAASGFAAEAAPTVLRAGTRTIDVRGKPAKVFGIRQPDGTAGIFTNVGARFRVRLENEAGEPTLIHWHGLSPPYQQDGVPGVSSPPIAPGGSENYDFPLTFPGTFWMHSHQGMQEQRLMTAPLIVRDAGDAGVQEVAVMLQDFSFRSPEEIFAGLRKKPAPAGTAMGGTATAGMAMSGGAKSAMRGMTMPSGGGMSGMTMDLNDVAYDAFLANDRTLDDPEIVRVEPGGDILLRVINGSSASNFVVDLGRLAGELVAVDGHAVRPVAGSRFPIAIAQRLDLRLRLPKDRLAHPVFAVLEGERKRTGIILAPSGARVARLGNMAAKKAAPLGVKLEQNLSAAAPLAVKPADRSLRLDLTGDMAAYVWGLNGVTYGNDRPLVVARGERVEIAMTNRTMMAHPMHLHGHFFAVVAIGGKRFPGAVRDTVLVPPMTTVVIAFDADNPGRWAFHCHNLYHMEAGMMTTVRYADS
jgi:FtsP/CotA-like multicopper oxidase with cupredoxin domain